MNHELKLRVMICGFVLFGFAVPIGIVFSALNQWHIGGEVGEVMIGTGTERAVFSSLPLAYGLLALLKARFAQGSSIRKYGGVLILDMLPAGFIRHFVYALVACGLVLNLAFVRKHVRLTSQAIITQHAFTIHPLMIPLKDVRQISMSTAWVATESGSQPSGFAHVHINYEGGRWIPSDHLDLSGQGEKLVANWVAFYTKLPILEGPPEVESTHRTGSTDGLGVCFFLLLPVLIGYVGMISDGHRAARTQEYPPAAR